MRSSCSLSGSLSPYATHVASIIPPQCPGRLQVRPTSEIEGEGIEGEGLEGEGLEGYNNKDYYIVESKLHFRENKSAASEVEESPRRSFEDGRSETRCEMQQVDGY